MNQRSVRIGVQIPPQHVSFADYQRACFAVEDMGVDVIFNWDHFFPLTGNPNGKHLEAWTTIAVVGSQLQRVDVGTLVLSIGYRNPALVSAMARTLDQILGGRLILGLGAGWFERDYVENGYKFGTVRSRLSDLEQSLEIIKRHLADANPPPARGKIPLLVAGAGEKVTLRIVARLADLWHTSGPIEGWAQKNRVLDEWCAVIGRDPLEIERTVSVLREDTAIASRLEAYVGAGATLLIYNMDNVFDLTPVADLLAWRHQR